MEEEIPEVLRTRTRSTHYALAQVPEQAAPGYNGELVGPWETGYASRSYFSLRAASIYSGSNEIQRNIIAKAVLGL